VCVCMSVCTFKIKMLCQSLFFCRNPVFMFYWSNYFLSVLTFPVLLKPFLFVTKNGLAINQPKVSTEHKPEFKNFASL
jgi:hypothetical protein